MVGHNDRIHDALLKHAQHVGHGIERPPRSTAGRAFPILFGVTSASLAQPVAFVSRTKGALRDCAFGDTKRKSNWLSYSRRFFLP